MPSHADIGYRLRLEVTVRLPPATAPSTLQQFTASLAPPRGGAAGSSGSGIRIRPANGASGMSPSPSPLATEPKLGGASATNRSATPAPASSPSMAPASGAGTGRDSVASETTGGAAGRGPASFGPSPLLLSTAGGGALPLPDLNLSGLAVSEPAQPQSPPQLLQSAVVTSHVLVQPSSQPRRRWVLAPDAGRALLAALVSSALASKALPLPAAAMFVRRAERIEAAAAASRWDAGATAALSGGASSSSWGGGPAAALATQHAYAVAARESGFPLPGFAPVLRAIRDFGITGAVAALARGGAEAAGAAAAAAPGGAGLDLVVPGDAVRVLSWNVLAEIYATSNAYPDAAPWLLTWAFRKQVSWWRRQHGARLRRTLRSGGSARQRYPVLFQRTTPSLRISPNTSCSACWLRSCAPTRTWSACKRCSPITSRRT